ncbi:hypothetical protein [Erwinia persicina]|uniref:hypothetical protein n=1 Tax=Erwinia persicina TaxID=55211 RepID=UPI00177F87A9|nr:hypothetical protein [Erwinia persicina]MBD8168684.1 hypothetical protein [Erwinia persicina]
MSWAPIIAALIAALSATFGLIITKENKISEFRQIWINELREALGEFVSKVTSLNVLTKTKSVNSIQIFEDITELESKVKLRLNLKKPSFEEQELIKLMSELKGSLDDETLNFQLKTPKFHELSAAILKVEWERVKRGELRYRVLLKTCYLIVAFLLILISIYSYTHSEVLIAKLLNK